MNAPMGTSTMKFAAVAGSKTLFMAIELPNCRLGSLGKYFAVAPSPYLAVKLRLNADKSVALPRKTKEEPRQVPLVESSVAKGPQRIFGGLVDGMEKATVGSVMSLIQVAVVAWANGWVSSELSESE